MKLNKLTIKKLNSALLCLVPLTLLVSYPALSAVYKCQVGGKTIYQSTGCLEGKEIQLKSSQHATGLHASWFKRPALQQATALCGAQSCQCGDVLIKNQSEPKYTLMNALAGLPEKWRFYHQEYQRYQDMENRDSFPALKSNLADSACRIAINQAVIEKYYSSVMSQTKTQYETAKAEYDEINSKCVKPDETGWTQSDAAKEYVKCSKANMKAQNKANKKYRNQGWYKSLAADADILKQPNPY
ncbi:hypothetical protein K6Y31_06605 [Motilimonas cestriensis]|uniref:DUF4124 domain-containing protein n=1 Tax=Motilimonas cestriensis TaxID=2742685 RepID=A0ABS8W883_9GAMM|nr:hypothetical protein [Motilimonas cestriensis]MCE2594480.1 hypothetical protein [Motilimonas cestriensis]